MSDRQKNNKELLDLLSELIEKNPEQRFSQILQNYGFVKQTRPAKPDLSGIEWVNEYYNEPEEVLKRVKLRTSDSNS